MAKRDAPPKSADEMEIPATLMLKVGPERFDVVEGVVRGSFIPTKVLEKRVSLVVGRGTARKALHRQHTQAAARLGLTVES